MDHVKVRNVRKIMDEERVIATITAMAFEVIQAYQKELTSLIFIGVVRRGMPIAKIAAQIIYNQTGITVPVIPVQTKIYNDDLSFVDPDGQPISQPFEITENFNGKTIIIAWDDVAYTLATSEEVFKIISQAGRAFKFELEFAVLIDRFEWHKDGREIYSPRFFGLRQSTKAGEIVKVQMEEIDGETSVWLQEQVQEEGVDE